MTCIGVWMCCQWSVLVHAGPGWSGLVQGMQLEDHWGCVVTDVQEEGEENGLHWGGDACATVSLHRSLASPLMTSFHGAVTQGPLWGHFPDYALGQFLSVSSLVSLFSVYLLILNPNLLSAAVASFINQCIHDFFISWANFRRSIGVLLPVVFNSLMSSLTWNIFFPIFAFSPLCQKKHSGVWRKCWLG